MSLLLSTKTTPVTLRLSRDLLRVIKRGHPWVFADALRDRPKAPAGSQAVLLDNKRGLPIAWGFYDAGSPLTFRVCSLTGPLTESWAEQTMSRAFNLRQSLFDAQTTGYRLFNGEGDGLPGLVADLYGQTAVLQLDGNGPSGFWNIHHIARWVAEKTGVPHVYFKTRSRGQSPGEALVGSMPEEPALFLENGVRFTADVIHGQKTGFFLDQRENRRTIGRIAHNKSVLNVFGYTGGFSVYAGLGGARKVTTVDLSAPALAAAAEHWAMNQLAPGNHSGIKADAFDFLENAAKKKQRWDMVVVDPPSFATSRESTAKAVTAYQKLIAAGAAVTGSGGLLAAASCSSHITMETFLNICEESVSKAQRRATLLQINSQPADHPTPLAFPEFRYLKFILMRLG
jgi:23S rRNA (cytosine1962-C5)-methyltransferase